MRNRQLVRLAALLTIIIVVTMILPLMVRAPQVPNFTARFDPPSWKHPLGTDQFGRDVLSRLIWGSRTTLGTAAISWIIASFLGVLIGSFSAGVGGNLDWALMRGIDIILAVPGILLAMLLVAAFGRGYAQIAIGVGISLFPGFSRYVRANVLRIRHESYIAAAEALGASRSRVILYHLVPNAASQIAAFSTVIFSWAILDIAGLEFLGLAGSPDIASLGRLLSDGRTYLADAPWIALSSGAMVTVNTFVLLSFSSAFGTQQPGLK